MPKLDQDQQATVEEKLANRPLVSMNQEHDRRPYSHQEHIVQPLEVLDEFTEAKQSTLE